MVLACPNCSQRFLSVFTETIDWVDGEDPQYWTTLPITPAESADLAKHSPPGEVDINAIGHGRRCLQHDSPKGVSPRSCWGNGILVGPHD